MIQKKINLALIAAGRMGLMHARNLIRFPQVKLTMVMDKHLRGKELRVFAKDLVITDKIEEVWANSDIDAVLIAASSAAHVDLVEQAVKAGKHIFCEKPVSFNSIQLFQLSSKVAAKNLFFQVAFNRRFDPQFNRVKQAVDRNAVGNIYMIKIVNRDPKLPPLEFVPNSGGMFFDFNVHDFDMIHYVSGEKIEEVQVMGANLIDKKVGELGDIDTTIINLRLSGGGIVSVDCSRQTGYGYDQQLEVFGEKGSVKAMNVREDSLMVSRSSGVSIAKPLSNFMTRFEEAYVLQLESFFSKLKQVMQGKVVKPEVGGFEAANAVAVAEAVTRAYKSKKTEKVVYPK